MTKQMVNGKLKWFLTINIEAKDTIQSTMNTDNIGKESGADIVIYCFIY